jgi:hypothetical protein
MQDSKTQKRDATNSDATSKETLEDLEKSESDIDPNGSVSNSGPSPDGAIDERDEIKDAGPM